VKNKEKKLNDKVLGKISDEECESGENKVNGEEGKWWETRE